MHYFQMVSLEVNATLGLGDHTIDFKNILIDWGNGILEEDKFDYNYISPRNTTITGLLHSYILFEENYNICLSSK